MVSDEKGLSLNVSFYQWHEYIYFHDMKCQRISMISTNTHFNEIHQKMALGTKYLDEGVFNEKGEVCLDTILIFK